MAEGAQLAPRTVAELLGRSSAWLDAKGSSSPRLDAELLLGHVIGLGRLELYLHHDRPLEPAEIDGFRELLRRRGQGEPVAYLLGAQGFRRLTLAVDQRVLVPRPETEALVEVALAALPEGGRLLDVGTGSGAVALAVAEERPDAEVVAADLSTEALQVAAANARSHGLERVRFVQSDLLDALADAAPFDVIAANLPYVPEGDERVEPGVHAHEPHLALYAGSDGLELIRRTIRDAPARLVPGGALVLEVGEGQAQPVAELMTAAGFGAIRRDRDLARIERIVSGRTAGA